MALIESMHCSIPIITPLRTRETMLTGNLSVVKSYSFEISSAMLHKATIAKRFWDYISEFLQMHLCIESTAFNV